MNFDGIDKALGTTYQLPAVKEKIAKELPVSIDEGDNKIESDLELVRNTLRSLVTIGTDAIEEMEVLAKASESPRAFEVLSTLMKTVADNSHSLLDIHLKDKQLKGTDRPLPVNIDKGIVFTGSSADLLAHIKQNKMNE